MENNVFGSEGLWVFALLILLFGGGFGMNGANNALTQGDLQRAIDLNSIQNGQRDIEARVQEIGAESIGATKDAAYNNLSEIRDNGMMISNGFANMQSCCCETNRNIDSVKFDMANYTASINANTTAQTQKVLDALSTNRMADMQNQINQLQLQAAMCGVPKINPYGYGVYPYNVAPFPPVVA